LLTAITLTILDVLDLFYGRKNVRLGVNGNPVPTYLPASVQDMVSISKIIAHTFYRAGYTIQ